MPDRQPRVTAIEFRDRARLAKTLVEVVRAWHGISTTMGNAAVMNNQRFGADLDVMFVYFAVLIGDFERRPMTVSAIADYIGLSRTTVLRKLDLLQAAGGIEKVDNFYWLAPDSVAPDNERLWNIVRKHMPESQSVQSGQLRPKRTDQDWKELN